MTVYVVRCSRSDEILAATTSVNKAKEACLNSFYERDWYELAWQYIWANSMNDSELPVARDEVETEVNRLIKELVDQQVLMEEMDENDYHFQFDALPFAVEVIFVDTGHYELDE